MHPMLTSRLTVLTLTATPASFNATRMASKLYPCFRKHLISVLKASALRLARPGGSLGASIMERRTAGQNLSFAHLGYLGRDETSVKFTAVHSLVAERVLTVRFRVGLEADELRSRFGFVRGVSRILFGCGSLLGLSPSGRGVLRPAGIGSNGNRALVLGASGRWS